MKIGLISDIHANRPALTSVLQALQGVDQIWCAGDITGYYLDPNGVVNDLLSYHVESVKGNHDWYLDNSPPVKNQFLLQSIETTLSLLAPDSRKLLGDLPLTMEKKIDGLRIHVYHGSPWDPLEDYIYPDYTDFERFTEVEADIIILGHTHYPMFREIKGRMIINPGSCGQPRDGNPTAAYAILDTRSCSVSFRRVAYDATELIKAISKRGLNKKLISYLPNPIATAEHR